MGVDRVSLDVLDEWTGRTRGEGMGQRSSEKAGRGIASATLTPLSLQGFHLPEDQRDGSAAESAHHASLMTWVRSPDPTEDGDN